MLEVLIKEDIATATEMMRNMVMWFVLISSHSFILSTLHKRNLVGD